MIGRVVEWLLVLPVVLIVVHARGKGLLRLAEGVLVLRDHTVLKWSDTGLLHLGGMCRKAHGA